MILIINIVRNYIPSSITILYNDNVIFCYPKTCIVVQLNFSRKIGRQTLR